VAPPAVPPPPTASLVLAASLVPDEPPWPKAPPLVLGFPPAPASASVAFDVELPLEQPSAILAIKIIYRRARMRESYHGEECLREAARLAAERTFDLEDHRLSLTERIVREPRAGDRRIGVQK
jgi:hypothetical protein